MATTYFDLKSVLLLRAKLTAGHKWASGHIESEMSRTDDQNDEDYQLHVSDDIPHHIEDIIAAFR